METYVQMRDRHQKEVNAFPMRFAFGEEQFRKGLEELGVTEDEVVGIGAGGFIRKADKDDYIAMGERIAGELEEAMKDPEFAYGAFYYEMGNHEYHINWQGDWDVCSCFGEVVYDGGKDWRDYLDELGFSKEVKEQYSQARSAFFNACEENDWF